MKRVCVYGAVLLLLGFLGGLLLGSHLSEPSYLPLDTSAAEALVATVKHLRSNLARVQRAQVAQVSRRVPDALKKDVAVLEKAAGRAPDEIIVADLHPVAPQTPTAPEVPAHESGPPRAGRPGEPCCAPEDFNVPLTAQRFGDYWTVTSKLIYTNDPYSWEAPLEGLTLAADAPRGVTWYKYAVGAGLDHDMNVHALLDYAITDRLSVAGDLNVTAPAVAVGAKVHFGRKR